MPRKYSTEKKTTTPEGMRDYQRQWVKQQRSFRKAKHYWEDQWETAILEDIGKIPAELFEPTGNLATDLKNLLKIDAHKSAMIFGFVIINETKKKTRELDNMDEVNAVWKAARDEVQKTIAKAKEM